MSEIDQILKGAPAHIPGGAQPQNTTQPESEIDSALKDAPTTARGLKGFAQDAAAIAVKGAIGVPETLVGLADIPTGGAVGKFLENEGGVVGFRPKQAKEMVNEWHSDATKEAQRKFQEADGIVDKTVTALQNPSLIATAVGESLPSMGAGGVVARGILAAVPKVAPWVAGAIGEGVVGAGSAAEQIRQETKDGLLTPEQSALAAATGVATTAFGAAGGKVAQRLGIGEADTMLAQGMKGIDKQIADKAASAAANPLTGTAEQSALRAIPTKVLQGAISEGFLEELPQSVAEQILQNLALDKPWSEDVDAAAVMGVLSGGAMGGAASGFRAFREQSAAAGGTDTPGAQTDPQAPGGSPLQLGFNPGTLVVFPDGTVGTQAEVDAYLNGLPEAERTAARAKLLNLGPEAADQPAAEQPSPGMQRLKMEALARLREIQQQEQGERDVPQSTPPDGAAVLAQQQAAEAAARQAAQDATRAVEGPDDEILQSTGAAERPSAAMGLRAGPAVGTMENAAVLAVDTGASAHIQQQTMLAQAAEAANKKGGQEKKPEKPAEPNSRIDPQTGEIPGDPHLSAWSDADLSTAFRAAQSREVRVQLANEPAQRRSLREQRDLQAELSAEQNAPEVDAPDNSFAAVREDAGPVPKSIEVQPTTGAPANGTKADQAQQGGAQPAQGAGTQAGQPAAQGLTNGSATTANTGAQAAPTAGSEGAAAGGQAEALRQQLRDVEAKILRAAPDAVGTGGGDIEAAMKSRKVPVPLKAQRRKLQEQVRAAQAMSLKDELGDGVGTYTDKLNSRLANANYKLMQANSLPPLQRRMSGHDVDAMAAEVSRLESKREEAKTLDAAAMRESTERSMLKSARQELDASNLTPKQRADAVQRAGRTGNAADASQAIFDAVDGAATGQGAFVEVKSQALGQAAVKNSPSAQADPAPAPAASPAPAPVAAKAKPRGVLAKKAEADSKVRADYFTPGNIVKSYGGNDRVISYSHPDADGRWSVTVRAVEKRGDTWVDKAGEQNRTHATPPDARNLRAGPVVRAQATAAEESDAHAGVKKGRTQDSTATSRAIMEMVGEGRAATDILRMVAGTSKSRFNRQVARLLLQTGVNPTVSLERGDLGGGDGFKYLAKYSRKNDALSLTPAAESQAEHIFLHETIHAATLRALDRKGLASVQMRRLYEHVKKQGGAKGHYGMKNVGEFVAEAFTNPEFQDALKKMNAPAGSSIATVWDSLMRIVKSILGLPSNSTDALSRALDLGSIVMKEDMALRQRGRTSRTASDAFALSPETRATFESRIDSLFNGGKAVTGTRVLDRSDVMGLLGHPNVPLMLNERHLLDGLTNHPEMTAAVWKKVPQWIENPAMVYSDPRDTGRLVVIAPEVVAGYPVMLVVEPNPTPAARGHAQPFQLLVTAYAKTGGGLPSPRYLASSGHLLYVDTKNAPEVLQRAGVQFPGQAALQQGRKKILTEKHLNGWRKANSGDAHAGIEQDASANTESRTTASDASKSSAREDDAFFGMADARALKSNALEQLQQAFTHEGKVSIWDKTVGTMRNLAERVPVFKAVYEAAQRQIDDVSTLANDAANVAPRLLPRVESLGDILGKNRKSAISAADNKAVAKPLFEGTLAWGRDVDGKPALVEVLEAKYASMSADQKAQLMLKAGRIEPGVLKMWQGQPQAMYEASVNARFENTLLKAGVVWSDAELKNLFGANEAQASLYREARATIDRSIDMTARVDMLRAAGEEYAQMRDAVLDAPSMADALTLLVETMEQEAQAQPDKRDRLADVIQSMRNRFDAAEKLQKEGYAPLQRFGRYTVDVVDQAGERQYFGMFESMREANQMKIRMKSAFPGAEVTSGTMSEQVYKLFQGLTPETMEQFGEMLGLKASGNEAQDKAFQAYLKLAKNNHSALKRLIHRSGIAGYSEDVGRVLASFVYSNARLGAGGLNAGALDKALNAIPKEQGELRDVAMGLRSYIQDQQEEGQAVRGMLFAQYLGGSVASALVNMTQPFQITMPWLSQFGGMKNSAAQMARAVNDMRKSLTDKNFRYEDSLAKALKAAEDDGTVSPQEIHQLMSQSRGAGALRSGDGTRVGNARAAASNAWEQGKVLWGQPFALAEQFNRRSTFIAAFRIAEQQGMASPAEFARTAVLETQFVYSKANKPKWARGAIGGTLFTFKTYSVSYLELMNRMWKQGGPEGKRAVGWAVAMLLLMGGAGGLPFAEDLEDLIDGVAQLMGYNVSSKQWRKQLLRDTVGKEMGDFIEQGVSGLPGAPIDVSGRLGMGNLIPGTGLFLSKQGRERDLLEIAGPAGDLVSRGFSGARQLVSGALKGDGSAIGRAALEVAPTAVRNLAKGAEMAASGMYKDQKGYKVIDTTLAEAAAKAIGFQPHSVAEVQEGNSFMQRSKSFYIQTSNEIKAQWAQALFDKDDAALQRVRDRLADWNRNNPEQPITVKIPDVMKRVREMNKDRTARIADTAPKALREQMKEMAKEAGQ